MEHAGLPQSSRLVEIAVQGAGGRVTARQGGAQIWTVSLPVHRPLTVAACEALIAVGLHDGHLLVSLQTPPHIHCPISWPSLQLLARLGRLSSTGAYAADRCAALQALHTCQHKMHVLMRLRAGAQPRGPLRTAHAAPGQPSILPGCGQGRQPDGPDQRWPALALAATAADLFLRLRHASRGHCPERGRHRCCLLCLACRPHSRLLALKCCNQPCLCTSSLPLSHRHLPFWSSCLCKSLPCNPTARNPLA